MVLLVVVVMVMKIAKEGQDPRVQLNLKVVNAFLGEARAGVSGREGRKITDGGAQGGGERLRQGTHPGKLAPWWDITGWGSGGGHACLLAHGVPVDEVHGRVR